MSILGLRQFDQSLASPRNLALLERTEATRLANEQARNDRQARNAGQALGIISQITGQDLLGKGDVEFKLNEDDVTNLMSSDVGRNAISTLANTYAGFGLLDGVAKDGSFTVNNFEGFDLAPPNEDGSARLGEGGRPVYTARVKEEKPGAIGKIFSIFGTSENDDPAVTFDTKKLTDIVNTGVSLARGTGMGLNAGDNFQMKRELVNSLVNINSPTRAIDLARTQAAEIASEVITGNSPQENAAKRDLALNVLSNPNATLEELEGIAVGLGADLDQLRADREFVLKKNAAPKPGDKVDFDALDTRIREAVGAPPRQTQTGASTEDRLNAVMEVAPGASSKAIQIRNTLARKRKAEAFLKSKEGTDFDTTRAEQNLERINEKLDQLAVGSEEYIQEQIERLERASPGNPRGTARPDNQAKIDTARSALERLQQPSSTVDANQQAAIDAATQGVDLTADDLRAEIQTLADKLKPTDAQVAAQILRANGITSREDLMRLDVPSQQAKYIAAAFAKFGDNGDKDIGQVYEETLGLIMYGDRGATPMTRANQRIDAQAQVNTSRSNARSARQDAIDLNFGSAADQQTFQNTTAEFTKLLTNPDTFDDPTNTTKGNNLRASLNGQLRKLRALFQTSPAASQPGTRLNAVVSDAVTAAETNVAIYDMVQRGSDGIAEWFRDIWRAQAPGGEWIQNPASLFILSEDESRIGVANPSTMKNGVASEVFEGTMTVAEFLNRMPQDGAEIIKELKTKPKY